MRVTFCGVRGSMPAAGPEFVRYGGHTPCVALAIGDAAPSLLLDAGTGLRRVTQLLGDEPFHGSVLLGHVHWDHMHGMPFFRAGARQGSRVEVYLPAQGEDGEATLARMMSPPSFPIVPSQLGPGWRFEALEAGRREIEEFDVLALDIPHKGGRTFGYRVTHAGVSVAYLSDHEPLVEGPGPSGLGAHHEAAVELCRDVDLLIHDAHIAASELPHLRYLGHACAEYALEMGEAVGARRVALFHHSPERTDDQLDALAAQWERASDLALVAREGDVVDLGVVDERPPVVPLTA